MCCSPTRQLLFVTLTLQAVWKHYHQRMKRENGPMFAVLICIRFYSHSSSVTSVSFRLLHLPPNALRGSEAPTLRMISFAGLSFSVTDIGFDVILLLTVQRKKCSHKFMVLPMGGVCVIQQGSFYWLIPSSLVI